MSHCPAVGTGGFHSESYLEGGRCAWCGGVAVGDAVGVELSITSRRASMKLFVFENAERLLEQLGVLTARKLGDRWVLESAHEPYTVSGPSLYDAFERLRNLVGDGVGDFLPSPTPSPSKT